MRHMSRLQILSLVVLAVLLGPYASVPARAAEPIKIGGLFELTGFLNPIGKDAYQGAMIAIEEQGGNAHGQAPGIHYRGLGNGPIDDYGQGEEARRG